ncbi:hypothetical protein PMKS-003579 [Pichia membranifaciens]|uniref:Uncharacterized protein n=1 Tax=Pichia membranifaciens TaxID=4926 RepID=A0A1Q2YL42_9ASCO|nr:hypothetical protein PMKS-003579 [Pichia membranifaciens]
MSGTPSPSLPCSNTRPPARAPTSSWSEISTPTQAPWYTASCPKALSIRSRNSCSTRTTAQSLATSSTTASASSSPHTRTCTQRASSQRQHTPQSSGESSTTSGLQTATTSTTSPRSWVTSTIPTWNTSKASPTRTSQATIYQYLLRSSSSSPITGLLTLFPFISTSPHLPGIP